MRMRAGTWVVLTVAFSMAFGMRASQGAVLCKKKSGVVVVRDDACRKKETAVALAELGALGPKGDPGEPGPRGPSTGYVTKLQTFVDIPDSSAVTLLSLDVPEGSYVVTARLHGVTITDPDGPPANSYRYDCYLTAGDTTLDDLWPRVGTQAQIESYLTYVGAFTGAGPIVLACSAGNGHPLRAISGIMTAVAVDAVEIQLPQ
ncbi:MAG: hypothetical protein KIT14_16000 [bacterium]|nr:hypothetical protein [bacterium]